MTGDDAEFQPGHRITLLESGTQYFPAYRPSLPSFFIVIIYGRICNFIGQFLFIKPTLVKNIAECIEVIVFQRLSKLFG